MENGLRMVHSLECVDGVLLCIPLLPLNVGGCFYVRIARGWRCISLLVPLCVLPSLPPIHETLSGWILSLGADLSPQLPLRDAHVMDNFKQTYAHSSVLKCHSLLWSAILRGVAYLLNVYPLKSLWLSGTCEKRSTRGSEHERLMDALQCISPLFKRNGRQTPLMALPVVERERKIHGVTIHTRDSKQTLHHWHVSQNINW